MASLDSLNVRSLLKKGEVRQARTNTPIAIRLHYVGTGTVTSVTTTTATNIVMITSDGGTDTYAFETYDTIGKLVDAINADGIFEAKVLDSVRSFATATQFVDGAITAASEDGVLYYDVKVDTDAALYFAVRITYDRGFDKQQKKSHRVHVKHSNYTINVGTAAADKVRIYEIDGTTETQILSAASVDSSDTTIVDGAKNQYITAKEGNDLVVVVLDAGSIADATTNFLTVFGEIE